MLARDWFYSERGRIGLEALVAARSAIYDHDDSGSRARATLAKLGVREGWRIADIGCGTGTLACEAAKMGAQVDAVDIAPAALALAENQARVSHVAIRTQSAGLLSFTLAPGSFDLVVSEFTLHHLPDFWKAVTLSRMFRVLKPGGRLFLRDIVFVSAPDDTERTVEQWAEFNTKNHDFPRDDVVTHMRDEHSTFGWVIERMLADVGFTLVSADYHAPLHGTYLCRRPGAGEPQMQPCRSPVGRR